MNSWREIANNLQRAAAAAPLESMPDLLAEVERVKATALVRIVTAQNGQTESLSASSDKKDSPEELMTPQNVADYLNVDLSWVYRHAEELQGLSLSDRCLRFRRSVIERHLDRCRRR